MERDFEIRSPNFNLRSSRAGGALLPKRLDRCFLKRRLDLLAVVIPPASVLHHENRNQAELRIDRHVRAVRAAVAEAAAVRAPAEAVSFLDPPARLPAGHLLHRRFGKVAFAVEFAVVEDHLAKPG